PPIARLGTALRAPPPDTAADRNALSQRGHVRHFAGLAARRHAPVRGPLPDDRRRMGAHPQHRRMENPPGARAGQAADPVPVPGRPPMSRPRILARLAALAAAALLLGGCASHAPDRLDIDTSVTAASQDSRVRYIVLHYTSAGRDRALDLLSRGGVSTHYLITDDARDRKSTRLNSSHVKISYAVFC